MYEQNDSDMNRSDAGETMETRETPNWNAFEPPADPAAAGDEYYYQEKNNRRKFLILPAICVVAIAGVYLMGLKSGPTPPSAADKSLESQVDKALTRLTGNLSSRKLVNDAEQMVRTFNDYPVNQQVNTDELQKNPFTLDPTGGAGARMASEAPKGPSREELRKALSAKASALALQSIIQTQQGGACMIGGEIYRPGQTLAGEFTVESIGVSQVTVRAGEERFVLSL